VSSSAELLARGMVLQREGRAGEALAVYAQAAGRFPGEAEPWFRIALVHAAAGQVDEALDVLKRALAIDAAPRFRYLEADLLAQAAKPDAAFAALERLVGDAPGFAPAATRVGEMLVEKGRFQEAIARFESSLASRPAHVPTLNNLALAYLGMGKPEAAEGIARQAIAADATNGTARAHLGRALQAQGALTRAEREFAAAAESLPDSASIRLLLANIRLDLGRAAEALDAFDAAIALQPADLPQVESARLLAMHYDDRFGRDEIFEAHRAWAARHAAPVPVMAPRSRETRGKLRVGYVSPRMHGSSAGEILAAVLEHHDSERFEIFCYAASDLEDGVTARLRAASHGWRAVAGLGDEALALAMRADGIDIAVDVAGHTPDHRLLAFARRPAPIAVTWLDYFDTTGLESIDVLLTDRWHSPPGDGQRFTEKLLRMPGLRYCWTPPRAGPPVLPPPSLAGGDFVFGSFNRLSKLSPATLSLWCEVLRAAPRSRLVIKSGAFDAAEERDVIRARFGEQGIDPARIEPRGASPYGQMLAEYSQIDVALDSFPYTGGVTTLEALWMGRPVLTIAGDTLISRQSAAILSCTGLHGLIAVDRADFIAKAATLASSRAALESVSHELRERVAASPATDAAAFTRVLESAFLRLMGILI
jgi:protein O-GlcNAc transferase